MELSQCLHTPLYWLLANTYQLKQHYNSTEARRLYFTMPLEDSVCVKGKIHFLFFLRKS